jgi:formamidopyrimidine-DNA glycosylase
VASEDTLAALGPEAWPDPPALPEFKLLLAEPRPLYALLRDQHAIAGIGRSWVDEILHTAQLSPFKRGADLSEADASILRTSIIGRLGGAIDHYESVLKLPLPDKLPLPLSVHRHQGEPCPRCGATLEAVFYEDYVMCYCPVCQTDGKVLKDRRLSRLLK